MMKSVLGALALSLYVLVGPLPAWATGPETTLLVTLQSEASRAAAEALIAQTGARVLERLRRLLATEELGDVPTSAFVVFTNPKVQLRIEGCSATVTRPKELKDVLRRMTGKGQTPALSAARIRDVQKVFDDRMRTAHSWR